MRAFAAVSIVVTHSSGVTGFNTDNALGAYTARLNFGVTLFFLLSGFLLYRPFVAARLQGRPPIRIRDFVRRRVLRIVPAYWVCLVVLGADDRAAGPLGRAVVALVHVHADLLGRQHPAGPLPGVDAGHRDHLLPAAAVPGRGARAHRRAALARRARAARRAGRARRWRCAPGCRPRAATRSSRTRSPRYLDWFCVGMALAVLSVVWWGREDDTPVLRTIVRRPWVPWARRGRRLLVHGDAARPAARVLPRLHRPQLPGRARPLRGVGDAAAAAGRLRRRAPAAGCARCWPGGPWPGSASSRTGSSSTTARSSPSSTSTARRSGAPSGLLSLLLPGLALAIVCAALSYYLVERPALALKDGSSTRRRRAASRPSAEDDRGRRQRAPRRRVVRLGLGGLAGQRQRLSVAALGVERAGHAQQRRRPAAVRADPADARPRRRRPPARAPRRTPRRARPRSGSCSRSVAREAAAAARQPRTVRMRSTGGRERTPQRQRRAGRRRPRRPSARRSARRRGSC